MISNYLPRTELIIIELRREGAPTITYTTNLIAWKSEAITRCTDNGPRTVCMFHWDKRNVMGEVQWTLLDHQEFHVDCF